MCKNEFFKVQGRKKNFMQSLGTLMKFMCKNKLFQSSGTKNELFKIQGQKTKLMYSLEMKTIFWPLF